MVPQVGEDLHVEWEWAVALLQTEVDLYQEEAWAVLEEGVENLFPVVLVETEAHSEAVVVGISSPGDVVVLSPGGVVVLSLEDEVVSSPGAEVVLNPGAEGAASKAVDVEVDLKGAVVVDLRAEAAEGLTEEGVEPHLLQVTALEELHLSAWEVPQ